MAVLSLGSVGINTLSGVIAVEGQTGEELKTNKEKQTLLIFVNQVDFILSISFLFTNIFDLKTVKYK